MPPISYDALDSEKYTKIISSPSQSLEYFRQFHEPVIEKAKEQIRGQVKVLALACGHGFELEFLKDDLRVQLIGTDLSVKTLEESTQKSVPDAMLVSGDIDHITFPEGTADVGIIVNGLIYKQKRMLDVLFRALAKGSSAVANFPVAERPVNLAFAHAFVASGDSVLRSRGEDDIRAGGKTIKMFGMDFDTSHEPEIKSLGVQTYFLTVRDAQNLAESAGFVIERQEVFSYISPRTKGQIDTDVFTLRKPE